MAERLTVVIPGTPSKLLAPNKARTVHYLEKAKVSSEHRDRGMLAALAVRPHGRVPMFDTDVVVEETIYWGKGERRVDLDGIAVMCKPFLDGICDAGVLSNDSQVKRLIVEQYRDPEGKGKVEIRVTDWMAWHTQENEAA